MFNSTEAYTKLDNFISMHLGLNGSVPFGSTTVSATDFKLDPKKGLTSVNLHKLV